MRRLREVNFSPRLRIAECFRKQGTGHPLNRDYEDFSFFETPAKQLTTFRRVSKIQETSLGREMYAIVRTSIHLHGLSTVHPLRSVCAFRFSVHLPPATRYSLPLSTIHPSFPPSDVQTFPNPSPRLENCLFSNLFSSVFSRPNSPISRLFRDITRIETRQFGVQRCSTRQWKRGKFRTPVVRQPNETKRNARFI